MPTQKAVADLQRASAQVQALLDVSTSISNWALLVLGGMLVVFLSTSYRKPPGQFRLIFIIPLPALLLLVAVLRYGSAIQRNRAALLVVKPEIVPHILRPADVVSEANTSLAQQIRLFEFAVGTLAVWLALYLIWWIFFDTQPTHQTREESVP